MPTLLEMGRLRAAAAAAAAANSSLPASSPSRTSSPSRGLDRDEDSDLPPVVSSTLSRTVPNMAAFGQRQLKRIKLAPGFERDYLQICETTNTHERQNLETLAVFQLLNKVTQMTELLEKSKAEEFKKNPEVNADVRNYSRAFILDPTTHFYTGNITQVVAEAMRKEKVANIPGKDAAHSASKAFEAFVGHQLSVDRNHIKTELELTLKPGADSTDIASVASRLIGSWGIDIPITLRLLWRIALMRSHLVENKGREFWASLDKQLHELRSDTDGGVYVYALQENFENDVTTYGKLSSDVALEPDIGPHSPKWLQRVRKLAADVENPKVTHPTKRAKTRKRARTELSDDEQRDGPHDEHGDRQDEDDGGGSEQ
ncbi:hypothetical protein C8F01DRAFT_1201095 [Mycena amicta]|nr:hypothetical protein C8F01DRAFT_1201095 [Mycena amicta]